MQFARFLRPRITAGEVTCSVRLWQSPRVKTGGRYRMGSGHVRVTSIREILPDEVTDALARKSGFENVADLLATARHGRGESVYLVEFTYEGASDLD